jgi:26S proteasome regulatory subunit N6
LEQNIAKLVKPYSSVQFQYLSEKLHLPVEQIESKIQAMILDGDLQGTIDQDKSLLILFEETHETMEYQKTLNIFSNLENVLDHLEERALKLKV